MGQSSLKQSTARLQAFLDSRTRSPDLGYAAPQMAVPDRQVSHCASQMHPDTGNTVDVSPSVSQQDCLTDEPISAGRAVLSPGSANSLEYSTAPQSQAQAVIALPPPAVPHAQAPVLQVQDRQDQVPHDLDRQHLDTQPTEKRCSHRKSTALAGVIHNEGSSNGIPCRIVDMSATGARVQLRLMSGNGLSAPSISDDFQLYLTYDRMSVPCSIEWRDGEHIGARFTLAPQFY